MYMQFKVGLRLGNVQKSPFWAISAYSARHHPPPPQPPWGMPDFRKNVIKIGLNVLE